jgi:hypothetical protein
MTAVNRTHLSRLGGLTRAALYDGEPVTRKARGAFAASFQNGHGCSVCPSIEIPVDLAPAERERRAAVLRKIHYTRIATLPRTKKSAPAATAETLQEVDRVSDDHHHRPE